MLRSHVFPILVAAVWISVSEFLRNEIWLKHIWIDHYSGLGLVFPGAPINGAVWVLWSLLFSISIRTILRGFDLLRGTILAWFVGFVLMWVVTWNMGVLPLSIMPYAAPLSILETFVATWIISTLCRRPS